MLAFVSEKQITQVYFEGFRYHLEQKYFSRHSFSGKFLVFILKANFVSHQGT